VGFVHAKLLLLLKAETAAIGKYAGGACARDVPHGADDDENEQHKAAIKRTTILPANERAMSPTPSRRCVLRRRIVFAWFFSPRFQCKLQPFALDNARTHF